MPGIEVLDRPHDKAIEQCDVARCSRPGVDATAWKELEVLQDGEKPFLARLNRTDLMQIRSRLGDLAT